MGPECGAVSLLALTEESEARLSLTELDTPNIASLFTDVETEVQNYNDWDPGILDCLTSAQLGAVEPGTVGNRDAGGSCVAHHSAGLSCCFGLFLSPCCVCPPSFQLHF